MGEEGYESKYASGGVLDKNGNPADRSKTGGWSAAAIILGAELSERMCVIGIASNLVTYLVGGLHLSNADAANIVTNFMGTLYLLCLLGGFVADALLGRFKTIAVFGTIQSIGVALLAFSASLPNLQPPPCTNNHTFCIPASAKTMALLYASLYITALGVGGVKSNVSGFGSDQFDNEDPKEQRKMIYFFNRFYFCISLGSLFAVTVLVYIQDNVGRDWGYGIPAGSMVMALAFFVGGSYLYRYRKPAGSPLTQIGQVLVAAWRNRNKSLPPDPSLLNQDEYADAMKRRILHTNQFRCLDKAAVVDPEMDQAPKRSSPWKISTIRKVEEVKMVLRLLPIWSTCIMFWTVYSQMTTFSVVQADTMDRTTGSFKIPSASLQVFLVGSIMFFATFSEKFLVPFMRRITGNVQGITSLQRIAVGLVLSIFAMLAAALVEKKRLDVAQEHGLTQKRRATVPLSVYWLVPQYFLVGAGEAFAYVGQLEFFIKESPVSMKSMSTGLFLSTLSLGFYLSSLLVTLVNKITIHGKNKGWLPNNLNRGRLDYFYWLLAVLSVINLLIFFVFARWYKYKEEWASSEEDHNSCDLKEFNSAVEKTKTEELEVYVDV
uniref:Major facilitator superfamily (MFS) profile domain-containing protein n=1 Tax=Araucaria cunninghamii TaxID=56994 RepID=A0A0D6QTJ4_ARACU